MQIYLNTFVLITPCIVIFADINECSYNRGGCEQLCINSPGNYTCSCLTGYTLQSDGKSCQDADECRINHGGCEFSCNNTESSYYCSCRSGHILAADKHSCLDIDECQSLTHQCPGKKNFLIITDSLKNRISGWNIDYQKVDDKVFFKLHGRGIKSCKGYLRFGHFLFCFRSL